FDASLMRARALVTRLDEEPQANPATGTMEFSLRDPDGYHVMVNALSADEQAAARSRPDDGTTRGPAS
ncbi:MAG TPA: hypothetical protein VGR31_17595, partial [Planctomycetota bacterium]|nr:hypothetical protein [Planctomycetota bacterium]